VIEHRSPRRGGRGRSGMPTASRSSPIEPGSTRGATNTRVMRPGWTPHGATSPSFDAASRDMSPPGEVATPPGHRGQHSINSHLERQVVPCGRSPAEPPSRLGSGGDADEVPVRVDYARRRAVGGPPPTGGEMRHEAVARVARCAAPRGQPRTSVPPRLLPCQARSIATSVATRSHGGVRSMHRDERATRTGCCRTCGTAGGARSRAGDHHNRHMTQPRG